MGFRDPITLKGLKLTFGTEKTCFLCFSVLKLQNTGMLPDDTFIWEDICHRTAFSEFVYSFLERSYGCANNVFSPYLCIERAGADKKKCNFQPKECERCEILVISIWHKYVFFEVTKKMN